MVGCTSDWFGGWDGLTPGTVDQFITEDGRGGRLPEVIRRGEPAVLVGHWPGMARRSASRSSRRSWRG
jgi:hypothetical protein